MYYVEDINKTIWFISGRILENYWTQNENNCYHHLISNKKIKNNNVKNGNYELISGGGNEWLNRENK